MRKLMLIAMMGLTIANFTLEVTHAGHEHHVEAVETVDQVEEVTPPVETTVQISKPKTEANVEAKEEIEFRVTAYCACEICCGEWAKNRPKDEHGNPIVIGAAGSVLTDGSCASPLPFGTEVSLEGYGTVTVEDRTADWIVEKHGKNIIDIYMTDHNEALQFGVKYLKGEVK